MYCALLALSLQCRNSSTAIDLTRYTMKFITSHTLTRLVAIVMAACCLLPIVAQRRITPVKPSTNKVMTSKENDAKIAELKQKGLVMVGDTILPDTVAAMMNDTIKITRMKYPLLTSVTIGANVWDPVMRLLGQKYGGIDFSAELSLWNRIVPIVELGIGSANNTPEEKNYTYKGDMALYGKIGCGYNFKYNNKPDYMALVGFRLGYSNFKYSINDISINNSYWQENNSLNIDGLKSHALWGELVVAMHIKLYKNWSAGWTLKYHFLFNYKSNPSGDPWYIPGYGTRGSAISAGMSIYYTLPLNSDKWPRDDDKGKNSYTGEPINSPATGSRPVVIPGPGSN